MRSIARLASHFVRCACVGAALLALASAAPRARADAPPAAAAKPPRPTVGAAAPDLALASSTGGTVKLADFRGKRTVVLAFFPKAFTGG
jgi:hypothetical protein